jgi:hypothetical protein
LQVFQIMKERFLILISSVTVFKDVLLPSVLCMSFIILFTLYSQAFAVSPSFDESLISDKEIINQKSDFIQTYGNASTHLGSNYANILAVNYVSDGKNLNTTFWLASNSENASVFSQPDKSIRYGMLIAIVALPENSGYNGANYDFFVEAKDGKWSEYLYQLSSTGSRALVYSKENYTLPFGGSTIGPGHVNLRLDLDAIHSPSNYGLSFYTAESFKSNEVRDFTNWIPVPPGTINIMTDPKDSVMRQGEEELIPAEFETPLSDNVTSITFDNDPSYSFDGLNVSAERVHPPLFRVQVSPQTPVGVYDIPILASMSIQTTSSKLPMFNDTVTGGSDPEFQISKEYPTIGYITSKANLTITVIPPLTVSETFIGFWDIWGDAIALIVAGAVGAFATFLVDHLKSKREQK